MLLRRSLQPPAAVSPSRPRPESRPGQLAYCGSCKPENVIFIIQVWQSHSAVRPLAYICLRTAAAQIRGRGPVRRLGEVGGGGRGGRGRGGGWGVLTARARTPKVEKVPFMLHLVCLKLWEVLLLQCLWPAPASAPDCQCKAAARNCYRTTPIIIKQPLKIGFVRQQDGSLAMAWLVVHVRQCAIPSRAPACFVCWVCCVCCGCDLLACGC